MHIVCHTLVRDLTHNRAIADDFVKTLKEALTEVAREMNASEAQVLTDFELEAQVRLLFLLRLEQ